MITSIRKRRFHALVRAALLCFVCRALVPVGYMPAGLAEGGPFVICHGTPAGMLFARFAEAAGSAQAAPADGGSHAHGSTHGEQATNGAHEAEDGARGHDSGHATEALDAWEHCPVGAASAHAALAVTFDVPIRAPAQALDRLEPTTLVSRSPARAYAARAPPRISPA